VQNSLKSGRLGLLALCFLLFTALVSAQSVSGELVGTIYDPTGATIPGATVTALNVATGVPSVAVSSSTGQYRLGNLAAGVYSLKVSAAGFSGAELKGVQVNLNLQATANVTLQVGESKTSVEVSGAAVTIDTTTAQVQGTFEAKQLADLPVTSSGSGVLNLALYTSGVSSSGAIGAGSGPSVGGQRPRNNNFTIEGIDNNSKSTTGPLSTIPNDAVAEFSILANQFSAQYGHSSGGQFNQVLKGGTNEFHGMGYEYMNNRTLNAMDQQDIVSGVTTLPRYDNNRFGGNLGGPIMKNKLFFFVDYEYNPVGASGVPGEIYAPTTQGYAALANIPGINQTNLGIMKQYLPAQSTALPGQFATICPGVQLGSSKINGVCPADTPGQVNIPLGQYSFTSPNYTNYYSYLTSIDYSLSDKDQIHGRYVRNNSTTEDTAAQLPQFWVPQVFPNYLATLTEYHNFSANLNNEFRLGFNRMSQVYPVGNQKFPGLDQFPNLQFYDLNGVQIGADPNAPQETIQNTYQLTDNVSWLKGAHTITAGVDVKKFISPQTFTQRSRGDYEYNYVNDYLFDFVPDYVAERTTGNFVYYGDQVQFGSYVNDSWKIRPNFTINLGVRYERTTLPYGERLQTVNAISNDPGLITFGEPQPQNLNFEPRLGFAYSPRRFRHQLRPSVRQPGHPLLRSAVPADGGHASQCGHNQLPGQRRNQAERFRGNDGSGGRTCRDRRLHPQPETA
jgi:outer membrane receptor protein involved in Fe transport